MSDSEAPISNAPAAADAKPAGDLRRRHRGRRGGRGRRPAASSPVAARPPAGPETLPPAEEPSAPAAVVERPAPARPASAPLIERVQRLTERAAAVEPAHKGSAISQAIDEVMQIVEALKRAVDQMEDVLELVELAERQKLADERELDSLRRAMRQLHQRPRGLQSRHGEDEPPREMPEG